MVAYPHQQLNTESAKKGWLFKLRISQPEGTVDLVMPGSITKERVRLASPTIDESQSVKHSLVINISPLRIASLIKVSKCYPTSQFIKL